MAVKHYLLYREKASNCILHIDATASVVKINDGTEKKPFYYAITFKPSDINSNEDEIKKLDLKTFSYANFITTNNRTFNLKNFLSTFLSGIITVSTKKSKECLPNEVVCDFLYPLMNSTLAIFNGERIEANLLRVYQKFVTKTCDENFTLLKISINHMMKVVSSQLSKKGVKKAIKKITLYFFGLLANTTSLESALEVYKQIYIYLNSKYRDKLFHASYSYLFNLIHEVNQRDFNVYTSIAQLIDKEENFVENEDFDELEYVAEKETIEETSLFGKDFKKSIQELSCNASTTFDKNEHYSTNAFQIIESYTHLYPYWSLLGNQTDKVRSRNAISESWFVAEKSHIMSKKLHSCPYDFVLEKHGKLN